jgi:hypothetical protein
MRRSFVLGLAVLLAAATAAADKVITAQEVISCRVVSASADSVRLTLTQGQSRTLPTWDVYEVRLSDTARVAELAVQLPRAKVILDSGQSVPPPEVRTREAMRLRLDLAREARAKGLPWHADVVDTLARRTTPDEMAARCRDMDAALRECGRSDRTIAELLREVSREQATLRRLWPRAGPALCLASGTGLGGCTGVLIGEGIRPTVIDCGIGYGPGGMDIGGGPVGCLVGSVAGSLGGAAIGIGYRAVLIARHRNRVNDLVRSVNRAIASLL